MFYFFFSANKSKHTTSNLIYLKWQKVGGGNLIFIFREEVPNKRNANTHLHTMNTKHQVLKRKMNLILSLKLNMWKCKNKKNKPYRSSHH